MKNIFLLGKEYEDTIITVDNIKAGETNECRSLVQRNGGIHNFLEVDFKNLKPMLLTSGAKRAYIINNKNKSKRTSFVTNMYNSTLQGKDINLINKQCEWLHVSYLDDLECYEKLMLVDRLFSVDFCTTKPRKQFIDVMNRAEIIFDSRERKHLYDFEINTPIIFHDEYGAEVYSRGKTIHSVSNKPIENLEVNGAGDIFSAFFLDNYLFVGVSKAMEIAVRKTTNLLIEKVNK